MDVYWGSVYISNRYRDALMWLTIGGVLDFKQHAALSRLAILFVVILLLALVSTAEMSRIARGAPELINTCLVYYAALKLRIIWSATDRYVVNALEVAQWAFRREFIRERRICRP